MKLTTAERNAGIAIKSLLIAKDRQGNIVRVTSPISLASWTHDGTGWILEAHTAPTMENTAGIYVTYKTTEARRYLGTPCKVILSGVVIEHETGARGQRARLLEVEA